MICALAVATCLFACTPGKRPPAELRRLGLTAGDPVRVTTRRGTIELKARADSAIAPGMVFVPFCYAEAAANVLTNPQLDPFGIVTTSYCDLVRRGVFGDVIERFLGHTVERDLNGWRQQRVTLDG